MTVANGSPRPHELNGHQVEGITEDGITPTSASPTAYDLVLSSIQHLSQEHLQELSAKVVTQLCLRRQQDNLAAFVEDFPTAADPDFKATQPKLLQSFSDMLQGLRIKLTEQALESTSSRQGTITLELPGLPEGVNVTRATESFFVDEGSTLLERNEVRVKLGGLDVYSGYWLAVDSPGHSIEDPLQEEGIDTLRRVMEAAKLQLSDEVSEDPLEYPFLSALLAPFGPEAILPFEEHLRALHGECGHRHGGCWFKMTSPRKLRSTLEQVIEAEGEDVDTEAVVKPVEAPAIGRRNMTDAEEADVEIDKLDL